MSEAKITPEIIQALPNASDKAGKNSRRQFLKKFVAGSVLAITAILGKDVVFNPLHKTETIPLADIPVGPPLNINEFSGVLPKPDIPLAEHWGGDRINNALQKAIKDSLDSGEEVTVNLPYGEIVVDDPIVCVIPQGARLNIVGDQRGSRLKLNPKLSDVPKEWGSFATRSIFYFKDMEGSLTLDSVLFDGGSERAGINGYAPPKSPWESMVLAVGKGEGDKYDPAMERAGKRTGEANITNCSFTNSESGGIVLQNLGKAVMANSQGQSLDAFLNVSWCDEVIVRGNIGEGFNSDGAYITGCQDVTLENWQIKTARQGFDLQGVAKATLTNCTAFDCAKAFELTMSETDKKTVSDEITLVDCNSYGSLMPFSIGAVKNLSIIGGDHDGIGDWLSLYYKGDFLHTDGIVDAQGLSRMGKSFFEYNPSFLNTHLTKAREIYNVKMRLGENIGSDYQVISVPGVDYTKSNN